MNRSRIWGAIAFVLVIGMIVGAVAGLVWLFALAIREGSTVGAGLIAALATVGAALILRYYERRKEMEAVRREALARTYEELAAVLTGHDMPQRKREKVVLDFLRKCLVYASPRTLTAFREWRANLPDHEDWSAAETVANGLRYEEFVKAMRRDLGISNWLLQEGDLSRTVQSDFEEVLQASREPAADG
jgi:hypothetical protein